MKLASYRTPKGAGYGVESPLLSQELKHKIPTTRIAVLLGTGRTLRAVQSLRVG